jgi:hypothetical protein
MEGKERERGKGGSGSQQVSICVPGLHINIDFFTPLFLFFLQNGI